MSLPSYRPMKRRELVFFDLRHGLPTTVRVLRPAIGWLGVFRVVMRILWSGLRDPLRDIPNEAWPPDKEVLVRHQLRGAVLLDDALNAEKNLDTETHHGLLHSAIAETGARFIQFALPLPAVSDWTAADQPARLVFLKAATGRFFNGEMGDFVAEDRRIGFDVSACRFAQLCRGMGRPHLATSFCAADSVFFARPESPVDLERTGTIASGAHRCDFRFTYRDSVDD